MQIHLPDQMAVALPVDPDRLFRGRLRHAQSPAGFRGNGTQEVLLSQIIMHDFCGVCGREAGFDAAQLNRGGRIASVDGVHFILCVDVHIEVVGPHRHAAVHLLQAHMAFAQIIRLAARGNELFRRIIHADGGGKGLQPADGEHGVLALLIVRQGCGGLHRRENDLFQLRCVSQLAADKSQRAVFRHGQAVCV